MTDTAVLIFRLVLGVVLFAHAAQKLLGWFGGNGLRRQATLFESLGLRPGVPMVVTASAMELFSAMLLVMGLATPLASLIAAGTMLVAGISLHLNSGVIWNSAGGGEYPYVLAVMAMSLGIAGAGSYSLDALLVSAWPDLAAFLVPSVMHAIAIPALALLSATPFVIRLRLERDKTTSATTGQDARS
jgi:putative oxidoreductase